MQHHFRTWTASRKQHQAFSKVTRYTCTPYPVKSQFRKEGFSDLTKIQWYLQGKKKFWSENKEIKINAPAWNIKVSVQSKCNDSSKTGKQCKLRHTKAKRKEGAGLFYYFNITRKFHIKEYYWRILSDGNLEEVCKLIIKNSNKPLKIIGVIK